LVERSRTPRITLAPAGGNQRCVDPFRVGKASDARVKVGAHVKCTEANNCRIEVRNAGIPLGGVGRHAGKGPHAFVLAAVLSHRRVRTRTTQRRRLISLPCGRIYADSDIGRKISDSAVRSKQAFIGRRTILISPTEKGAPIKRNHCVALIAEANTTTGIYVAEHVLEFRAIGGISLAVEGKGLARAASYLGRAQRL
jgi:hypothetical protein